MWPWNRARIELGFASIDQEGLARRVNSSAANAGSGATDGTDARSQGNWQLQADAIIDDRYRVLSRIGGGGMGEVYEVEHLRLGRHFAAKVLRRELASEATLVSRFASEVKAMACLRSDYVAQIVDTGTLANQVPYFVMEQLTGRDLKTLLRECGSLPVHRAVRLIIDACWGLQAVHAAGLVHRDIKPSNLFVAKTDCGAERCMLLDFGVSKSSDSMHTHKGQLIGTLQYMAPEQLEQGRVDARTDLYALGAVLYECLVGHPPHRGETMEHMLYGIMNRDAIPLWKQHPGVSSALSDLVSRAIARNPGERFEEAKTMAAALRPHSMHRVYDDAITASSALSLEPDRHRVSPSSWNPGLRILVARGCIGVFLACLVLLTAVTLRRSAPTPHTGNRQPREMWLSDSAPDAVSRGVPPAPPSSTYTATREHSQLVSPPALEPSDLPSKTLERSPLPQRPPSRGRQNHQLTVIDPDNPYDP